MGRPRGDRTNGAIAPFFTPRGVAVVGVSAAPGNLGRHIVENLVDFGFSGDIIPVGPREGEVAARRIVPSLAAVPNRAELAVVLVPAARVLEALDDCGRAGVRAVVISSGGFGEFEASRSSLEQGVLDLARRWGFRVMGPNCIGVVNLETGLCLPFAPLVRREFARGPHSLVSQSGGVMLYVAEMLSQERLGVNILVSEGNKLEVDEAHLLPYLAEDPGTRVIFLYLEGIARGRELVEAAARSAKPVVALKANVAEASAGIARSHTRALANDERVVDAAFRQAGLLRARDLQDFVLCAKAFSLPPLRGDSLVVACMSGGMSVIAADACARHGFRLPSLPAELRRDLERLGRGGVMHAGNPLDLGDIHDTGSVLLAVERILALPDVDGLVFCMPSPAGAARVMQGGLPIQEVMSRIKIQAEARGKPVALSFFADRRMVEPLVEKIEMPIFWSITESIEALAFQREFWRGRARARAFSRRASAARVRQRANPAPACVGETSLLLPEALSFLDKAGIPVEPVRAAATAREAGAAAEILGYPVALKLLSPQASHKTELGGVALRLGSRAAVETACRTMIKGARARAGVEVHGVAVQRMCPGEHEVLIGARRDPAFGPLVVFGLGGVWVEALDDIALRLAPIDREDALEMVGEIRGASLLRGLRETPAASVDGIVEVLLAVSRLVVENSAILELDLNPVIVGRTEARVVDARIIFDQPPRAVERGNFRTDPGGLQARTEIRPVRE